jgi:hypothetical protein
MKKIILLAGIAAAVFGAVKLFKGGEADEFAPADEFSADEPYAPAA